MRFDPGMQQEIHKRLPERKGLTAPAWMVKINVETGDLGARTTHGGGTFMKRNSKGTAKTQIAQRTRGGITEVGVPDTSTNLLGKKNCHFCMRCQRGFENQKRRRRFEVNRWRGTSRSWSRGSEIGSRTLRLNCFRHGRWAFGDRNSHKMS
jgi:hypothetical protein